MPMPAARSSCNHGCVCHHDANGRIQPPCYTCTIQQCSLAYRPGEPSAPPEEIVNDGLLQVPPQARSPTADAHYGWRRTLTRISSNNNNSNRGRRTATNIAYADTTHPATYQENTGVTTIQINGSSNISPTEANHGLRELYVRLPSESAVAHSYPALSTIAASNEPTLLIAETDDGGVDQHNIGRTQEYEAIPDDVSIDYSMSEESDDTEDESLNNESSRISQFPLPRISVPKKISKQKTKQSSKPDEEDFSETDHYSPSKRGLLTTIIRDNSAWGSSEDSSLSTKYKVKGKMCKQNHLNIPGIVHQHYAMHKENRNPVYDTRKKVYQSRDYEARWQNLHTWMGHATSEEL